MSGPETEKLNQISVAVARLEVTQEQTAVALEKVSSSMERLVDKLERSDVLARKAEDRASSAHHRIDEEKKRLDEIRAHYDGEVRLLNTRIEAEAKTLVARIDNENEKRRQGQRWIVGTMLTAAGLVVAIIKLF